MNKGLEYAEQNLGVHSVYEAVKTDRDELDKIFSDLSTKKDSKREVESLISDRELEITSDERGKHPDMSQAEMGRHLKLAFGQDDSLKTLHKQIRELTNDIEGLEYDRSIKEVDIKIGVARLSELGGYLVYLAALKGKP